MATPPAPASKSPAGGKIGPFPIWVWIVGVGAVALYLHSRNSANAAAATLPTPIAGVTDPNTGLPVNPSTGLPYTTSQPGTVADDLTTWLGGAFAALTKAGVDPALANKALYDYSQGNALDNTEAGAIDKALGLVGMPPQNLPFFGSIPTAPKVPKPVTPQTLISRSTWLHLTKAVQGLYAPTEYSSGNTQISAYTFLHLPKSKQSGFTPSQYGNTVAVTQLHPATSGFANAAPKLVA